MVLHTENVDNVDNFVNNYNLSMFSRILNVDNFVSLWGEISDNFIHILLTPLTFVHSVLSGSFSRLLNINY